MCLNNSFHPGDTSGPTFQPRHVCVCDFSVHAAMCRVGAELPRPALEEGG